jgi:PAS domain S-box-containing protein
MFYKRFMALDYHSLSRGELIRFLELCDRRYKARAHSEERYRALMEQAADGIFIVDGRGICLEVNHSGARMLGMSPREIVGRHLRDFVAKVDIATVEADLASLRRNKTFVRERRIRRKDGSLLPVEVTARRLSDGRIQGTLRNITVRKEVEQALRRREERFRSLTAASFEGICISEQGRILDLNEPFAAMFGYPRDELIGRKILTLVALPWRRVVARRIRMRQAGVLEHQLLRKDGGIFEAEARSKVISWQGRRVRVTALRDITGRKKTERALRESGEKALKAFRASPDGLAISELATGRYLEVNDGYCKLYGYRRKEMIGRTSLELGLWENPKERALLVRGLKDKGKVRNLELHTRARNGRRRTILLSADPIEIGGKACLVSVLHDITDRIRAEQALRESEEKYAKAFRNSPDAVMINRLADGRIIEVNEGFRRVFGWPLKAAIGRTTLELRLWGHPADRQRALQELHRAGFVRGLELPFRTREGKIKVGVLSAEKMEINGDPCLVAVVRDITERVRAEVALRASEESLRATIEYTPNVAVQWFDARGRVRYWNRASERMYGWTAAEALGKTLARLIFAPADADRFQRSLKAITRTGRAIGPVEFPFHRRNGVPGIVLSTVFRMPVYTGELRFVCMDVDITEQKAAEAERTAAVLREQQARAEYTLQLIEAQEAERARIAAEIHDSLGQNLLLIKNRAQLALTRSALSAELSEQLTAINHLATQSIAEARQIAHDLHPHQLNHLGLTRALEAMLDSTARSSGIRFQCKLDNVDDLFAKDAAMNLYRIVQESLNNILKHSGGRQARIRLERDVHEVQLRIADNGRGFNPAALDRGAKGLGLKNIVERVRMLGGKIKMDSQPGRGTRLRVSIPIAGGIKPARAGAV